VKRNRWKWGKVGGGERGGGGGSMKRREGKEE
jgi:hypothetical protein